MPVSRFFLHCLVPASLALSAGVQAQTADSLPKATVSDEQMLRGQTVFTKVCLECHTKTDVTGPDFKLKWHTRPVFDLFESIRTTMPDNAPGTLTRDEYIDVVTYLLRLNGAPPGGMPISHADTSGMRKIRMEITVPPPNIDSVKPKTDSMKVKTDTLRYRSLRLFSPLPQRDSR